MTPPTHAPHAARGVLPHASPSARRTLLSIARRNPLALLVTFALITLENLLLVTYPLFAGFAIDAIVQGEGLKASSYALIVLLFWLIGALRRSVPVPSPGSLAHWPYRSSSPNASDGRRPPLSSPGSPSRANSSTSSNAISPC